MLKLTIILLISLSLFTRCLFDETKADQFLVKYGYMETMPRNTESKSQTVNKSLQLFQWATGLPITG